MVAQVLTEAGVSDSEIKYAHGFWQKAFVLVALRFYHRRLLFLTMWTSAQGCLRVFITWQMDSPRASDMRGFKEDILNISSLKINLK